MAKTHHYVKNQRVQYIPLFKLIEVRLHRNNKPILISTMSNRARNRERRLQVERARKLRSGNAQQYHTGRPKCIRNWIEEDKMVLFFFSVPIVPPNYSQKVKPPPFLLPFPNGHIKSQKKQKKAFPLTPKRKEKKGDGTTHHLNL